jgi:hypothetical protein
LEANYSHQQELDMIRMRNPQTTTEEQSDLILICHRFRSHDPMTSWSNWWTIFDFASFACLSVCVMSSALMLQEGFRPQGWLGLILGTRLYFNFYPSAVQTEPEFQTQIEALTREVGDRGKVQAANVVVSEGVPHSSPAPAPALAPAPATRTPSRVLAAPAQTPEPPRFSPSMQQQVYHQPPSSSAMEPSAASLVEKLLDEAKVWRTALSGHLWSNKLNGPGYTVLNQTLGRNRKQLRVCVVAIDTGGTGWV